MNIQQVAQQRIDLENAEFDKSRKIDVTDLESLLMLDPDAKVWETDGQYFISAFSFFFATYKGTVIELIEEFGEVSYLAAVEKRTANAYVAAYGCQDSTLMLLMAVSYIKLNEKRHEMYDLEKEIKALDQSIGVLVGMDREKNIESYRTKKLRFYQLRAEFYKLDRHN